MGTEELAKVVQLAQRELAQQELALQRTASASADAMFDRLDQNRDGVLDRAEFARYLEQLLCSLLVRANIAHTPSGRARVRGTHTRKRGVGAEGETNGAQNTGEGASESRGTREEAQSGPRGSEQRMRGAQSIKGSKTGLVCMEGKVRKEQEAAVAQKAIKEEATRVAAQAGENKAVAVKKRTKKAKEAAQAAENKTQQAAEKAAAAENQAQEAALAAEKAAAAAAEKAAQVPEGAQSNSEGAPAAMVGSRRARHKPQNSGRVVPAQAQTVSPCGVGCEVVPAGSAGKL